MISSWFEVDFSEFRDSLLKDFWDLKLGNKIIELKSPLISHFGGYGGVFLGSLSNLDLKIFEKLTVEFPGLAELRKAKKLVLDLEDEGNKDSVNSAYYKVLQDLVVGRDFPLFMLTIYSAESAANLYPINNKEQDVLFLNSLFSTSDSSTPFGNRSVLYVKINNKRCTGQNSLDNYLDIENEDTLYISYRIWDSSSFMNFAKNLSNSAGGNSPKVMEFMNESNELMKNKFYLFKEDDNRDSQ